MEWYEELYYDENPFDTNPKRFSDKLVGLTEELNELLYRTQAGSMVFIQGKDGFGKTSLLWNVIKKYRGKGRIIYVDCEKLEEDLNIEELMVNKQGLIRGRLLKMMPQGMILLLDNVTELTQINSERVKYFFDQGYVRSVIFTGNNYSKVNFSESLKQRIGKRIIQLKPLDEHQAVMLIRNRIQNSDMISDNLIKEIFKRSNKNPKKLLKNCEKLFSHVVESNEKKITKKHLKLIEG